MKNIHYNRFHFWGTGLNKKLFQKFYSGYTGIDLFGRSFIGISVNDNNVVKYFKKDSIETERLIELFLYIVHWKFLISLFNISYIGNIKKYRSFSDKESKWYNGYTGIKIFDAKFIGFNISDNVYPDERYVWVFFHLFGFIFSVDLIGKVE